jgi:hypothetical protein
MNGNNMSTESPDEELLDEELPAFTTPEEAVVFLYNRFMHAGVSECVARHYARDLKKIIDSVDFHNP